MGGTISLHDFNGDGGRDVLAGSAGGDGAAQVFHGVSSALLRTFVPPTATAMGVAIIGDVDMDAHVDVVGWQPELPASPPTFAKGAVSLFSGRTGAFLRQVRDATFELGWTACSAGDVDQDGKDDVLVGAIKPDPGVAIVYSGGTGLLLRAYPGEPTERRFGYSVLSTDLNGDGRLDHVVGATGEAGLGTVRAFHGVSGVELFRVSGTLPGAAFGSALAVAADQDGDARPELLIGSALHPGGGLIVLRLSNTGTQRSFRPPVGQDSTFDRLGGSVTSCPDLNGDGVQEVLGGGQSQETNGGQVWLFSGQDGTVISRIRGFAYAGFGASSLAAGDLDNDGVPELVVGAVNANSRHGTVIAFSAHDPIATVTTGTAGCPAGNQLVLSYTGAPRLGQTVAIQVSNGPPSTIAVILVGFTSINVPLTAFGMPGCTLWTDVAETYPLGLAGSATLSWPIPRDGTVLFGFTLHHQALALDRTANPFGVSVTNRGSLTVGF